MEERGKRNRKKGAVNFEGKAQELSFFFFFFFKPLQARKCCAFQSFHSQLISNPTSVSDSTPKSLHGGTYRTITDALQIHL